MDRGSLLKETEGHVSKTNEVIQDPNLVNVEGANEESVTSPEHSGTNNGSIRITKQQVLDLLPDDLGGKEFRQAGYDGRVQINPADLEMTQRISEEGLERHVDLGQLSFPAERGLLATENLRYLAIQLMQAVGPDNSAEFTFHAMLDGEEVYLYMGHLHLSQVEEFLTGESQLLYLKGAHAKASEVENEPLTRLRHLHAQKHHAVQTFVHQKQLQRQSAHKSPAEVKAMLQDDEQGVRNMLRRDRFMEETLRSHNENLKHNRELQIFLCEMKLERSKILVAEFLKEQVSANRARRLR
ncbi:hypothetical protein EV356DRAFT_570063 [Viridothelium virens]|uniref:Uncharacterized protein n=1 Tax=Viridothelium virens TaxID=1048519 RepID=A0A6A6GZD8_VIRVR|nr:hypothetical protein EV356DRAFT_570063 [Viridothelium virens]